MRHLEVLVELYDKVTDHLESHVNYPKWEKGVYPGRKSVETAISSGVQYGCFAEEKLVGAFILNEDPQGAYEVGDWITDAKEGEYLVIHTLASDPECYGQGIGKAMVEYAILAARESKKKSVRLDVVPDNIPARKLYEKIGFAFAGEKNLGREIEEIPLFALYELKV